MVRWTIVPKRSGEEVTIVPSCHAIYGSIQRCITLKVSRPAVSAGAGAIHTGIYLSNYTFYTISCSQIYSRARIDRLSDLVSENISEE